MSNITKQLNELIISTLGSEQKENGLNRSIYSPSKYKQKKIDPIYQSSSPSLNTKFIQYSSPSRSKNSIELIVPKATSPFVSHGTQKIKKEINFLNKNFNGITDNKTSSTDFFSTQSTSIEGYRNRPILNLQRNDLDFSAKNFVIDSPTNRMLVTPSLFGKTHSRNNTFDIKPLKAKKDSRASSCAIFTPKAPNHDEEEHKSFMREMSIWKEKKINEWKNL